MKIIYILGTWLIGVLVWPGLVVARTPPFFAIESFRAAIVVNQDASIHITETISTKIQARHGIFRNIPDRYRLDNGDEASIPITIQSVRRNEQPEPYQISHQGDQLVVKIGDPDKYVNGAQTYQLVYTAEAAVNFFEDHDELYWNVTGTDWETRLATVQATVTLPAAVPAQDLQLACYTGPLGSRATECTATADQETVFSAKDFLTIVVGWPKGVVTKPDNYDQLRQPSGRSPSSAWYNIILWANIFVPVAVAFSLWQYWRRHGRDPKDSRTIIAQYDPPPGLTPGEMGVLFDEQANQRDIVATIIGLAVRGYLEITEVEKTKMLGLGKSKDYRLTRKTQDYRDLRGHERDLMTGLFTTDVVHLSTLKGEFADDVKLIQHDLYQQVADDGYFHRHPDKARKKFLAIGGVCLAIGVFLFVFLFGLVAIGGLLMIFARFMPKRTTKGVEALWQARGFKLFLEKAEKYRLQWQEREHIFEKFLPYAMAFGVADKWSKAFAGLNQPPPAWYHGPGTFNSLALWSALSTFSTVSARSFSPPAASGGSGFGGGGFSGGGGGGGGGGSW